MLEMGQDRGWERGFGGEWSGNPNCISLGGIWVRVSNCISLVGYPSGHPTASAWGGGSAEASQHLQGWSVSLRVQEGQCRALTPAAPTAPLVGSALKGTSA